MFPPENRHPSGIPTNDSTLPRIHSPARKGNTDPAVIKEAVKRVTEARKIDNEIKDDIEWRGFGKIPRLKRDIVITEKLDGTNAQIYIQHLDDLDFIPDPSSRLIVDDHLIMIGSKNRWITPENDNFGFAKWVQDNKEELIKLGPGRHFGEWWGQGIQRRYGLQEKRFSLFNISRWDIIPKSEYRCLQVSCCYVVPVLYSGPWTGLSNEHALLRLKLEGSFAAPGFMDSEGIIVYHAAAKQMFKQTIKNDEIPKSNK